MCLTGCLSMARAPAGASRTGKASGLVWFLPLPRVRHHTWAPCTTTRRQPRAGRSAQVTRRATALTWRGLTQRRIHAIHAAKIFHRLLPPGVPVVLEQKTTILWKCLYLLDFLKDAPGLGRVYETDRRGGEENPVHGRNTTINVDKIRGFRPPYVWTKTFVLLHSEVS